MTPTSRSKSVKIADPAMYFADWCFDISPHHYWTLGVELKTFVLRKVAYKSYAIMSPADYNFAQGYVFYAKSQPNHFLQIGAEQGLFEIEVFDGCSSGEELCVTGWLTKPDDLAQWLRTGCRPQHCHPLDIAQSKSGLMAWQMVPKNVVLPNFDS